MKVKNGLIATGFVAALLIGTITYAMGPGGGSMGGGSMAGGGHGMMGGGHMMDYGRNFSSPWGGPYRNPNPSYQNEYRETEQLRKEITQKRRELADLYRSDTPDNDLIDRKIDELDRLEAELDRKMSGY